MLQALPRPHAGEHGVWAWKCLQHVPAIRLPLALAGIHRALPVGGRLHAALFRGERHEVYEQLSPSDDDFPGRLFTWWEPDPLADLLVGAGFDVDDLAVTDRTIKVECTRAAHAARRRRSRHAPARVRPEPEPVRRRRRRRLRRPGQPLLAGRARGGDRRRSTGTRGTRCAHHGVGFTDLVKRATVGAAELTTAEYADGLARVERLCELAAAGRRSPSAA